MSIQGPKTFSFCFKVCRTGMPYSCTNLGVVDRERQDLILTRVDQMILSPPRALKEYRKNRRSSVLSKTFITDLFISFAFLSRVGLSKSLHLLLYKARSKTTQADELMNKHETSHSRNNSKMKSELRKMNQALNTSSWTRWIQWIKSQPC